MTQEQIAKLREEMLDYVRNASREELQADVDRFNERMRKVREYWEEKEESTNDDT